MEQNLKSWIPAVLHMLKKGKKDKIAQAKFHRNSTDNVTGDKTTKTGFPERKVTRTSSGEKKISIWTKKYAERWSGQGALSPTYICQVFSTAGFPGSSLTQPGLSTVLCLLVWRECHTESLVPRVCIKRMLNLGTSGYACKRSSGSQK